MTKYKIGDKVKLIDSKGRILEEGESFEFYNVRILRYKPGFSPTARLGKPYNQEGGTIKEIKEIKTIEGDFLLYGFEYTDYNGVKVTIGIRENHLILLKSRITVLRDTKKEIMEE